MIDNKNILFWQKINKNLFIISHPLLEDFRAVLSSKISRRLDLEEASNLDKLKIEKFLLKNLSGYNHASIAEMSFPTIFLKNIGWVSSWLLEDDKLFVGQEVSTRAVSKNILKPCMEFNYKFQNCFELFKKIFVLLKKQQKNKKGYRFDYIRWSLPGGFSTGVVFNMNSRVLNRLLCRLRSVPWFNQRIVDQVRLGFQKCCSYVSQTLSTKSRNYSLLYKSINIKSINNINEIIKNPVNFDFSLFKYDNRCLELFKNNQLEDKQYLDIITDYCGMIKIKIYCSLSAARDWHRHRTLMPWKLSLITDKKNQLFIYPLYDTKVFKDVLNNFFQQNIVVNNIDYYDLYKFPLGTTCVLEGIGTLSNVVYMLKLRAYAENANFEYRFQAIYGLKKLNAFFEKM